MTACPVTRDASPWAEGPNLLVPASLAVGSIPAVAMANLAGDCMEASDQPFAETLRNCQRSPIPASPNRVAESVPFFGLI
jgi:hypothetical protein